MCTLYKKKCMVKKLGEQCTPCVTAGMGCSFVCCRCRQLKIKCVAKKDEPCKQCIAKKRNCSVSAIAFHVVMELYPCSHGYSSHARSASNVLNATLLSRPLSSALGVTPINGVSHVIHANRKVHSQRVVLTRTQ